MYRRWIAVTLLPVLLAAGAATRKPHKDFVPDAKTAVAIAEAVLVGQFGEERVKEQIPLLAEAIGDIWLVQGLGKSPSYEKGGNFGVWIDRHSGCVRNVVEKMK